MPPPPSDTLAMPPVASRKRRRRPRPPSRPRRLASLLALAAVTSCLLHTLLLPGVLPDFQPYYAAAKEITATREWQRLSENDTLPAGLHVRMDLSTGEKWAKLPDDGARDADVGAAIRDGHDDVDDNGEREKAGRTEAVEVDAATGAVSVVEAKANDDGRGPDGGDKSAANGGDNHNNSNNDNGEAPLQRDYAMMHRVMSRLPPDELARFGGLPALPSTDAAAPSSSAHRPTDSLTGAPRDAWEQRMERLWTARQAALAKAQENIADLPSLLRERIATIEAYLGDVTGSLANVLAGRKLQADDNGSNEEEEKTGMANDILSALRDLAFQLSDVDLARDFRTLGGWAPLVSLLDEEAHLTAVEGTDELQPIADEVRALAAATIGTAVGNVGEFRPWALAAVATEEGKKAESALSLLVSSFRQELAERSESMGGNTVAVASGSDDRQTARATYKLRAAYALGALLRGNPAAQRAFVSWGGAETLARDALGTVSAVRGPAMDAAATKLDWRFASKVLALGEDVVADVALHRENYRDGGGDEQTEAAESAEAAAMTAGQLVAAFATERWCDLSLRMLAPPTDAIGGAAARGIQERALGGVRQLAPGCLERSARAGDEVPWGTDEVRTVRAGWQREGGDDGADASYRGELLALADAVLEGLQEQ